MQKEGLNSLYKVIDNLIPKNVLVNKNKTKKWEYGYNEKYGIVVISKDGTLGEIYNIQGLLVGLPLQPKKVYTRSKKQQEQYWERQEHHKELKRINSIFQWNERSAEFKDKWVDYIESEFDKRDLGYWFMNNGNPTYITGTHCNYLQ